MRFRGHATPRDILEFCLCRKSTKRGIVTDNRKLLTYKRYNTINNSKVLTCLSVNPNFPPPPPPPGRVVAPPPPTTPGRVVVAPPTPLGGPALVGLPVSFTSISALRSIITTYSEGT